MQAFSLSEASYPEWFRVSASVAAGQDLNPLTTEPVAQWTSTATDCRRELFPSCVTSSGCGRVRKYSAVQFQRQSNRSFLRQQMGFLLSEPPLHPEHLQCHRVAREHLSLGDRTQFNSRQEAFKDFTGSQHKETGTFHLYNKLLITAGWITILTNRLF